MKGIGIPVRCGFVRLVGQNQLNAALVVQLSPLIKERKLSQTDAAKLLGIKQPGVPSLPSPACGGRVGRGNHAHWREGRGRRIYCGGQWAPASAHARMICPKAACVPGAGARPTPGDQAQPTRVSSPTW